jgi:AraC-like DNA-binding protein
MVQTDSTYWYGVTAAVYIATCWIFSVVRGIHNCGTPKERRAYIWPDRKMQVIIYLTGTVLLPYVLNPQREAAWILMKSYFPCTYYFYCGALIFCFFGTVKQWKVWKKANFVAAILTDIDEEEAESSEDDELAEERNNRIATEIEQFVSTEAAYLDSHLKLEQVVERCNFSRRYVSKVFTERFGGFSDYVNGLRLNYFERYKLQHPNSTDESAAEASGFTSYKAYLKAKERLPQK